MALAEPCEPAWHPFESGGEIGVSDTVPDLTVWNGDLIVAGAFTTAGGRTVNHIARWDGKAWHPLTSGGEIGVNGGWVRAVTVWNGDLIAAGSFTSAGGRTVNRIARWDGKAWHPLASGGEIGVTGGVVRAVTVWDGDLIVGGTFTMAGGQTANQIVRWDGSMWHPFTSGGEIGLGDLCCAPMVLDLTVWKGDLIVAGKFPSAGGQTVNHIARWDGEAWHPFTTSGGQTGVSIHVVGVAALTLWNGDLIAGGDFHAAGGQTVNYIARWDGSKWHPFTSGGQIGVASNWGVWALTVWNGDLVAGGDVFSAGGQFVNRIARWDGEAWHPFSSGGQVGVAGPSFTSETFALTEWDDDLIAGGPFTTAGGQTVNRIARWAWPTPGGPADLNCDGIVDVFDLLILLGEWGECADPEACPADLTGPEGEPDGVVNVHDLLKLISSWG